MKQILLIVFLLFAAATCNGSSTKLKMSWKNPTYSGQRFKNILVIGMSNNLERRADFEVALANAITSHGITAMAGTDMLLRLTAGPLDLQYLREQIAAYKIDAVIVSRLVKVKTDITYIPGQPYFLPYYGSFYDDSSQVGEVANHLLIAVCILATRGLPSGTAGHRQP